MANFNIPWTKKNTFWGAYPQHRLYSPIPTCAESFFYLWGLCLGTPSPSSHWAAHKSKAIGFSPEQRLQHRNARSSVAFCLRISEWFGLLPRLLLFWYQGCFFVVVLFGLSPHFDYPLFRDNLSLFTWGFAKYYLAHLNIQIFLVPIFFFFWGEKGGENRSDVSFSCTPISEETRAGYIVAYTCIRLNLEPL